MPTFAIKRVYDPASTADGYRVLVDRLWPRGLTKEKAAVDHWAKALAPSNELRRWFGRRPERWDEFRERYRAELDSPEAREEIATLRGAMRKGDTSLVYAASDAELNNAVVLRDFLKRRH